MSIQKVLLVDDEPDIRTIGKIALESVGGWEVQDAESGAEAIELAPSFQPDVILLDVMMPQMDGPTTLGKLREIASLKNVPIIFLTAKVQRTEIDHFLSIGAIAVLPKPFDPMTLAHQVDDLVSEQSDGESRV